LNSKIKAKKLISQSLLISPEKRKFLAAILDDLDEKKIQQLIQILETEPEGIVRILENNFAKDVSGEFLKKFDELIHAETRGLLDELESKDATKEKKEEEEILAKINAI
jgi:hypothetical protein